MSDAITLFKHNPSAYEPELLEKITVQREDLIAELLDAALDFRRPRHQLLVGPRGMGKTHLLSLVDSRVRAHSGSDELVVAWVEEDAWTIRTYEKLLAEVAGFVGDQVDDPALPSAAQALRTGSATGAEGEKILRQALGDRRLLLMVENLDQVFRKIGDEGQARLRDLVEDWGQVMILGTAPQVFGAIVEGDAPFHDFFEVTELEELTVDSAMELMRRIAKLSGDQKLLRYLGEERAKKRFAAIEALAGGHPRIWLLFAGCISVEAIEELVPLFLKALDELTPYYQARLAELGDQQQELVVLLSEAGGALSNRALSERSGIAQNQVASMLGQLTDKGYVRPAKVPDELAGGDSRMSFWELREPLMRLCLDVKKSRGKPLRMVIEFLRAWYGSTILDELARLPAEAELAVTYASEAFRTLEDEIDFENLLQGSPNEVLKRAELALSLRPEPEFQLAKAAGLFMKGDFAGVKGELEELVDAAPPGVGRASINVQLAVARRALGEPVDLEKVAEDLRVMRDDAEDNPHLLGFVAAAFTFFNLNDDALAAYERAAERAPDDSGLQAGLGIALGNVGRHEEALEAFTAAIELDPSDGQAHKHQGIALHNLDRLEEALAAFEKAVEEGADSGLLQDRRARVLHLLGRDSEALEASIRAVELEPQNAAIRSNHGAFLARAGHLEETLNAFLGAVETEPGNAIYQANLGATLRSLGRLDEALAPLTAATELAPENAELHVYRGSLLRDLARPEEALTAFDEALKIDPSAASVWNSRGIALSDLQRFEQALESFGRAAEIDPSNAIYQSNQGSALGDLGRFEEALETFGRAIEIDPQAVDLHVCLGMALDDLGRFEEALEAFEKALEIDPGSANTHNARANSLRVLGRLGEAEAAARGAIELDPANAIFHFTLAEVIISSGDFDAGLAALREALAVWRGGQGQTPAGESDLLCQILWGFRNDAALAGTIASLVDAYTEAEATDELVRGIVSSVPLFAGEEVEDAEAEAWVEAWASVPAVAELEIPVTMLRAALAWKRDRDRAHLLELPLEQREILVELLNK